MYPENSCLPWPVATPTPPGDILDALRSRLEAAITVAGLPEFTASFGVVEALDQEDLPTRINRADAALVQAKRDGGDRVVIQDSFSKERRRRRRSCANGGDRRTASVASECPGNWLSGRVPDVVHDG